MRSTRRFTALAPLFAVSLLGGCGAKTGLSSETRDGGTPISFDSDAGAGADGGTAPVPCVEVPYREPPRDLLVSFEARIRSADVLFLVDVTNSMEVVAGELRERLRERIVPALVGALPALRLSVATFQDFPVRPYGSNTDRPFTLLQRSTTDIDAAARSIGELEDRISGGLDQPEAHVQALYHAATGEGLGALLEPGECPPDTVGYPCFPRNGARIVLLFSNSRFHNGPDGRDPYEPGTVVPLPVSYENAVAALRSEGAKVIGLFAQQFGPQGLHDMQRLARDTGAVTATGEPLAFEVGRYAERLDDELVDAVSTLVEEVPIDLELKLEDVAGDGVDATELVRDVRAVRAEPRSGGTPRGERFERVQPGTRVSFRLRLKNRIAPPAGEPRRVPLRLVLLADDATRLEERTVHLVIPDDRMRGCGAGSGDGG